MNLRSNANTNHEGPEFWYGRRLLHITTKDSGNIPAKDVDSEWLLAFEDDLDINHLLEKVVEAYRLGDLGLVEERLEIASREERQYGDDSATQALRSQLLEG